MASGWPQLPQKTSFPIGGAPQFGQAVKALALSRARARDVLAASNITKHPSVAITAMRTPTITATARTTPPVEPWVKRAKNVVAQERPTWGRKPLLRETR
jgi:hypothetical protein